MEQETPSKKAPPQQKIEVILVWFKVDKIGRLEFQEVLLEKGVKIHNKGQCSASQKHKTGMCSAS